MKHLWIKRLAILGFASVFWSTTSFATSLFENMELEGHSGLHLVIKNDVNVRMKPDAKAQQVTKLSKNDIVTVKGRVVGTQWVAITRHGKELGFAYNSSLTPMIDASLSEPLTGTVDLSEEEKPTCSYTLNYEGRAVEEEIVFVSTDYQATFVCDQDGDKFDFNAFMFMSEVPHDLGNKPIYQVTLNLPDIATGYEEFLSATALFDLLKQKVIMDAVSLEEFKEKELRKTAEATTAKEALSAAIGLQLASFNKKAWDTISGKIPNSNEPKPQ